MTAQPRAEQLAEILDIRLHELFAIAFPEDTRGWKPASARSSIGLSQI